MFGSANKLQRDLSVATLQSKATAATMEGSPCTLTRQLELADMAELLYRWLVV